MYFGGITRTEIATLNRENIVEYAGEERRFCATVDEQRVDELVQGVLADIGPLLSLVLYSCADDRDLSAELVTISRKRTKVGEPVSRI